MRPSVENTATGDFRKAASRSRKRLLTPFSRSHLVHQVGLDHSVVLRCTGAAFYVSNLTLYLPYAGKNQAIDSAWTLKVKGYTVSQIRAVIPPIDGGNH